LESFLNPIILRNFFDYIFYRFGKAYYKWDKGKATTSVWALTFMQTFLVANLIYIPIRLIYPVEIFSGYKNPMKIVLILIMLLFFYFNHKRYSNLYDTIKKKYENESYSFIKGILVFIAVFGPMIILLFCATHLKPLIRTNNMFLI
jgi:uncharacterized membrane protein YphA (DoxX/SURF4 family)